MDRAIVAYFNTAMNNNNQDGNGGVLSPEISSAAFQTAGDAMSDNEGSINFRQTQQAGVRSAGFFNAEELLKGSQHKQ